MSKNKKVSKKQLGKYKKVSKLIETWKKEDDPHADENWSNFEKEMCSQQKKYRTILVIESDFDPSELGNVQLVLDTVMGDSVCVQRNTQKK